MTKRIVCAAALVAWASVGCPYIASDRPHRPACTGDPDCMAPASCHEADLDFTSFPDPDEEIVVGFCDTDLDANGASDLLDAGWEPCTDESEITDRCFDVGVPRRTCMVDFGGSGLVLRCRQGYVCARIGEANRVDEFGGRRFRPISCLLPGSLEAGGECGDSHEVCAEGLVCGYDGLCRSGAAEESCTAADDCDPGLRCVGWRTEDDKQHPIKQDEHGEPLVVTVVVDTPGRCSAGALGHLCFRNEGCAEGSMCIGMLQVRRSNGTTAHEPGRCREGVVGDDCESFGPLGRDNEDTCGEAAVCRGGVCVEGGCEKDGDCESQLCGIDGIELGMCVSGAAGGDCTSDAHCGPGLSCIESSGRWAESRFGIACTDGTEGSMCIVDGDCGDGLKCVLEFQRDARAGEGVCAPVVVGAEGSPCRLLMPAGLETPMCDIEASLFDNYTGQADCPGDFVCRPGPGCGAELSLDNPICEGSCGLAAPGDSCLSASFAHLPPDDSCEGDRGSTANNDECDHALTGDGTDCRVGTDCTDCGSCDEPFDPACWDGWNLTYPWYRRNVIGNKNRDVRNVTYGCGNGQYCYDGACTIGNVGDRCYETDQCDEDWRCFQGACIASQ